MKPYIVVNFYKFVPIPDYESLREPLLQSMVNNRIKGTIILASEGINGSFAGCREDLNHFIAELRNYPELAHLSFRENLHESNPFEKSKVKLRKEIVSLGVEGVDAKNNTGIHLSPEQWNELLQDENTVVIDTRNDYEVCLGTFKGAINPKTVNFRDFPHYVETELKKVQDKNIAMFCTGGIRCEKSTAYLKELGFKNVFQLNGGILNYLESMPKEHSLWEGACFVFDNRVAVNADLEALEAGTIDLDWKHKHRELMANQE